MSLARRWDEPISLPGAVRFPVEMIPPAGFDPEHTTSWPRVLGRLEFFEGRLWYMPPCGDEQQDIVADVVITLGSWVRRNPGFLLGTNEAGMRIADATRAADAAIWRRADVGAHTGGPRRQAPILAVEVAGQDDTETYLRDKASWYLSVGAHVVWLVLPETREVVVLTADDETRFGHDATIPPHPALPGLTPAVRDLFVQLDGG